jgi:thioredoxin-like negative regulator of GroEL
MPSAPPAFPEPWLVVCLCAAWCGVCRDWTPVFAQLEAAHPDVRFGWVDVEDEADAIGELDIETFPTLLVGQGARARFLGPVQPSAAQVSRLLESLQAEPQGRGAGTEADALLGRLQSGVLSKR